MVVCRLRRRADLRWFLARPHRWLRRPHHSVGRVHPHCAPCQL